MARTYLVTGGAGFIGSNYIHYMFRKYGDEIRIINVDALTYAGNLANLKDLENRQNYTFVKADICDKDAIRRIFEENEIDRVVHFAAESHVDRSIRNPEVFVQTNVYGTAVMLNCAKIRFYKEIRSRFAGAVRTVRRIRCCFIKISAVLFQRAIYLIRRNMQEFLSFQKTAIRQFPGCFCTI